MKLLLLTFALLALAGGAPAGTTGKIMGMVTDPSGDPLVGASVIIQGTTYGSMTDAAGEYYIPMLSPGEYTVVARMVGMGSVTKEGVTVVADQSTRIDFQLTQEASGQTVIQVTDQRSLILEDVPSTIHVIDRDEIKLMPVAGILDVVRRQPGVVSRGGALHVRGGRAGEVAYMLDGIEVDSPLLDSYFSPVPLVALQQASITTGGLTAEYGNAMSGVVNMVTREGGDDYSGEIMVRRGEMSEFGWENESRNYSTPAENDNYRSDCWNVEAAAGGPEPITSHLLPLLGVRVPGKARVFGSASWLRSGRNLEDSRGFWENNWQNGLSGSGKLTYRPSGGTRLSLLATYSYRQSGWDEWLWSRYDQSVFIGGDAVLGGNPDYALPIRYREDYGFTFGLTQVLSDQVFLDFKANRGRFCNWRRIRSEDGGFRGEGYGPSDWVAFYLPEPRLADSVGFYHQGVHPDVWLESQSFSNTARVDVTSRFGPSFELKGGVEGRYYDIYDYSVYNNGPGSNFVSLFEAFPYSGSAYLQTTSRFSGGLVVNAGMRYDYFNANTDRFSPADSGVVAVDAKTQLSPRIGITNPVTERDVFFATYGHYFQMPNLNQLYFGTDYSITSDNSIVGNPDLDAERTNAYELGFRHRLTDLSSVAVSAFYKDITGLVRTAQYYSETYNDFFLYENDDSHGNVRGAEVRLLRLPGTWWSGNISYTYSIAKGRYSSPTEAYRYATEGLQINIGEDNYLDWDQRHTADAHLTVECPRGDGPRLAGYPVLEGASLSLDWTWGSGFPYSPPPGQSVIVQVNTERYPFTMQTDLGLARKIWAGPVTMELGITVYNLFDRKNLDKIYDVEWYNETGEPGGVAANPGAWSPARHAVLRMGISW